MKSAALWIGGGVAIVAIYLIVSKRPAPSQSRAAGSGSSGGGSQGIFSELSGAGMQLLNMAGKLTTFNGSSATPASDSPVSYNWASNDTVQADSFTTDDQGNLIPIDDSSNYIGVN